MDKIKEYLKNPDETKLFCLEFRFDFDSIKSHEEDGILKKFSINHIKLIRKEDFLDEYSTYEDKRLFYNSKLKILIIKKNETFLVLSLNKKTLEELISITKDSTLKNFIIPSEIKELENTSILFRLPYPFFLEEFSESKKSITTDFYDKLSTAINAFKGGIKGKDNTQHYFSYILICSLLEELFSYISKKEGLSLNDDYNIANCINQFEGKGWLITSFPEKKEGGELKILSKEINGKNIFSKDNTQEGKRIVKLLNEIKSIRKKYIHFVHQEPNNPSDNLIGILCFGQFLIWCEENGYL